MTNMKKKDVFINIEQITKEWLIENGYDGLYEYMGDCGCHIDDLFPCGEYRDCCAGYKQNCKCGEHDFHIGKYNYKRRKKHEQETD